MGKYMNNPVRTYCTKKVQLIISDALFIKNMLGEEVFTMPPMMFLRLFNFTICMWYKAPYIDLIHKDFLYWEGINNWLRYKYTNTRKRFKKVLKLSGRWGESYDNTGVIGITKEWIKQEYWDLYDDIAEEIYTNS